MNIMYTCLCTESSGDDDGPLGLHPFTDRELLDEILLNSVDIMHMSDEGSHPPTFSILSPEQFLLEQPNDTHALPPNFVVSLSYKPLNNTYLSLFSLLSYPQTQPQNSTAPPPPVTVQSEFMLSHSAAVLYSDSYYDLWRDFSALSTQRYNLNLIVMNGRVGMCLDGQYLPPVETVQLWKNVQRTDSLEMRFSPYLDSIHSMVYNSVCA